MKPFAAWLAAPLLALGLGACEDQQLPRTEGQQSAASDEQTAPVPGADVHAEKEAARVPSVSADREGSAQSGQ